LKIVARATTEIKEKTILATKLFSALFDFRNNSLAALKRLFGGAPQMKLSIIAHNLSGIDFFPLKTIAFVGDDLQKQLEYRLRKWVFNATMPIRRHEA